MAAAEKDVQEKVAKTQEKKPVPAPDEIIMQKIKKASEQLDSIDQKRDQLNADSRAIIERLESEGINRHAFKAIRARMNMKETKREGFDLSYVLVGKALGDPLQTNWLDTENDAA